MAKITPTPHRAPAFALRLREARKRVGISQMTLGVLAGIDEMSASPRINQYERGKHVPDLEMMARLASVLGVPTAYFLADEDLLARWILAYTRIGAEKRSEFLEQFEQAFPDASSQQD